MIENVCVYAPIFIIIIKRRELDTGKCVLYNIYYVQRNF